MTKGQQKRHQHRDNKGADKGLTSTQVDREVRGAWNRMGRAGQVRREANKSRSDEPAEQRKPQVELEGEC